MSLIREPKLPTRHRWGGNYADIPLPHRRFYDDRRRKRLITVEVTKYPGGRHYYVKVVEADNPIRVIENGQEWWVSMKDDPFGVGKERHYRCSDVDEAQLWVQDQLKQFSPRTHHIPTRKEFDFLGTATFGYAREGD